MHIKVDIFYLQIILISFFLFFYKYVLVEKKSILIIYIYIYNNSNNIIYMYDIYMRTYENYPWNKFWRKEIVYNFKNINFIISISLFHYFISHNIIFLFNLFIFNTYSDSFFHISNIMCFPFNIINILI